MLTGHHILTVLSLLPLSLCIIFQPQPLDSPPASAAATLRPRTIEPARHVRAESPVQARNTENGSGSSSDLRVKARSHDSGRPHVAIGGVELDLIARRSAGRLQKRATNNGTVVYLGTAEDTYVVPVSIGSPATSYPLQLDLASSDLLLASTLCTSATCPTSLGTTVNPYYDVSKTSSSLQEVNSNQTAWNTSYADGTAASGFVVRETVTIGDISVEGQVLGLINSTNLTLSDQKISGILGLGFPRLSTLAHILLEDAAESTTTSESTTATATSSSAAANATAASSAYLPPLLESLVKSPHLPYPVFGLALAPPPTNASATSTSSSATASSTSRYQTKVGSLTLGGVSSLYVSANSSTGRSISDIEWHDVMPFGRAMSVRNDTADATATNSSATAVISSSTSASSTDSTRRKRRSTVSSLNGIPSTETELGGEEYLFWTLELKNVSMNGTNVGLTSSYSSIGLPSIALLDAGSNGIYGPQQDVIKLFDQITDARQVAEGQWAVPCSTKMTMGFSFGGRYVQLQPSDWMYAQVASSSFCLAWPMAVAETGDGIDWQLGTPFLKNVYSIFSYGINGVQAPLVGFLPLQDSATTSTTSASATATTSNTNTISTNASITSYDPDSPTPTSIAALTLTKTINTVLPNELLSDPTYSTPSYVYSASPTLLSPGVLQYEGLANSSAYSVEEVMIITQAMSSSVTTTSKTTGGTSDSSAASEGNTSAASKAFDLRVVGMIAGTVLSVVGMWIR